MPHDFLRLLPGLLAGGLLAACASVPDADVGQAAPPPVLPPASATRPAEPATCPPAPVLLLPPERSSDAVLCTEAADGLDEALAYAERVRPMAQAELQAELRALGDPGHQPSRQMQVALVLMLTQQPADTARALGLLQRLQSSASSEADALRPLARLLAGMLSSQRRLEEQLERHAAQLRDAQRRIDLLADRLDAMRAIERSLGPRGGSLGTPRPTTP